MAIRITKRTRDRGHGVVAQDDGQWLPVWLRGDKWCAGKPRPREDTARIYARSKWLRDHDLCTSCGRHRPYKGGRCPKCWERDMACLRTRQSDPRWREEISAQKRERRQEHPEIRRASWRRRGHMSAVERDELRRLRRDENWTLLGLAERYGITVTAVEATLNPRSWPRRTAKLTDAERSDIVRRKASGETAAALAREYSVSVTRVWQLARQAKSS
jgi:hypothetical protein